MNRSFVYGFIVLIIAIAGCIGGPTDRYREDPFGGNFIYSGEPRVGEEVEVVFTMKPLRKFDNATIRITINTPGIDDGLQIIEGSTTYSETFENPILVDKQWIFDEKEFPLKLRVQEEGKHQIRVETRGYSLANDNTTWIADGYKFYNLYIISSKDSGEFARKISPNFYTSLSGFVLFLFIFVLAGLIIFFIQRRSNRHHKKGSANQLTFTERGEEGTV